MPKALKSFYFWNPNKAVLLGLGGVVKIAQIENLSNWKSLQIEKKSDWEWLRFSIGVILNWSDSGSPPYTIIQHPENREKQQSDPWSFRTRSTWFWLKYLYSWQQHLGPGQSGRAVGGKVWDSDQIDKCPSSYKIKDIRSSSKMNVAPVFKHSSKNIAKGTTDPRVEFISEDHSSQFTNLEHITIPESRLSINFKFSTKH